MNERIAASAGRARRPRRGELPRHESGQRPLSHGLRELERRARRRPETASSWPRTAATSRRPAALEGVEVVQAERDLLDLARRPAWRARARRPSPSRPTTSPSPGLEPLSADGVELVPTTGVVVGAPRGEGRRRARRDPARGQRHGRRLRAARRGSSSSAGPRPRSPGGSSRCSTRRARRRSRSRPIVGAGPNAALPHHHPGARTDRAGRDGDRRRGRAGRRLLLRLHADVRHRRAPRRPAAAYALCRSAQESALSRCAPARRRRARRDRARAGSRRRGSHPSSTASATASGSRCTSSPCCGRSRRTCSWPATSSPSSRASTWRAKAACGSRTSSSSARRARRCSSSFTKDLAHAGLGRERCAD